MKYIKYDEYGRPISVEGKADPKIDEPAPIGQELNITEPLTKKFTIRGVVIGIIVGLPVGAFAELIRVLTGQPWDDFFLGILLFAIVFLVSAGIGYVTGSLHDRE